MAHGAPDYSNVLKPEFTHRVDDMAELTARLSNAVSLERRGETIFVETFQYGFSNWDRNTSGTGGAVNLTGDDFVSKGLACNLVAGSDSGRQAKIDLDLPYLSLSKVGVECRAMFDAELDAFGMYISYFDGTHLRAGGIRYYYGDELIKYNNSSNVYVELVTNVPPPDTRDMFSYMKVVLNLETDFYMRAIYNERSIDMSNLAIYKVADATAPKMIIILVTFSNIGFNTVTTVDNIIVTRNE